MSTDAAHDLLSRYAREGDQAAFAEVVRAFAPLVWRVAMRRLGDAHLAEEAAQNVFVALARKAAALTGRPGLVAWLHRAATLEASNLSRSRTRRDQRLHEMARLTPPDPASPTPDDSTSPTGPWLDDALNRLSTDERSLVLGRFYEERSFRDLGEALGKSEEAAKKQSRRALAKMESFLRHRGVGVTGVALTSLLGAEFSRAAVPAHITTSLVTSTTAALTTGAAAPSLLTKLLIVMSTAKMTASATGVLLLLAATAGWQHHANASLRKELNSRKNGPDIESSTRTGNLAARSNLAQGKRRQVPYEPLPNPLDAAALVRIFLRSDPKVPSLYDPGATVSDAEPVIDGMTPEQLSKLLHELDGANASSKVLSQIREWLVTHLAKTNPKGAMTLAVANHFSDAASESLMTGWANREPQTAWAWLRNARADGMLLRSHAAGRAPAEAMLTGFAAGLVSHMWERYRDQHPSSPVAFTRQHLAEEGAEALVIGVGRALLAQNDRTQFLDLVNGLPTVEAQRQALVQTAKLSVDSPFEFDLSGAVKRLTPLFDHAAFPSALRNDVLRETAAAAPERAVWSALNLVSQASPPDQRAENLAWLAERFAKERPAEMSGHLTLGDPAQQAQLDAALAATAEALAARGNTRLAKEFAEKVRNEAVRTQTLNTLTK